jgi:lia operon protein LiaF
MQNRGQLIFGGIIILLGVMFLIGNIFKIDIGALCFPTGLILLGAWLLLRPRLTGTKLPVNLILLGDYRKRGAWQVDTEEIWTGIGDVDLDYSQAEIPAGETQLRCFGFIGDIKLRVPAGVGVSVSAIGFITDLNFFGKKSSNFFNPISLSTEGYETAERKIHLETGYFIEGVKIKPA